MLDEKRKRIRASRGWTLRRELHALARSYRLFLANACELHDFLRAHAEGPRVFELWDDSKRNEFERFLDEVDRLLHNYLAAVATLRDHSRRVWNKFGPTDSSLQAEHRRRITETFEGSPLAHFVKDLRNYTLHRRLPVATGVFTWRAGMGWPLSRVVLHRSELGSWPKWSAPARRFIEAAPTGELNLLEVVDAYTQVVVDFNSWFGEAYVRGHLPAFDELEQLEHKLAAAYAEATAGHA